MRAFALALALTALSAPAFAATVTLRSDTTDADGRITLGELFDGAGAASGMVVGARIGPSAVLDAGAVQAMARRAGLEWSNPQGIRRIVVRAGAETASAAGPAAARGNVEVLTWTRSLAAGEIVQPSDMVWSKAAAAPADAPRDAEAVIGLAAKRPLRSGAVASARDVSAPQVIKAGDMIAVTYTDGGISLTLTGKALAPAATGDLLSVQNMSSKKIIQAIVTGPGAAAIGPESQSLRGSARSFAVR
jgi:flagella basal body P-ring formation protein FlgA